MNGEAQTPVATGDPIHITVSSTGVTSIRLVGSTTDTDIGRLLLHGATSGRVDVLIGTVNENPTSPFPADVDDLLLSAGRHWGGLVCDDFNLRGSTRVAFAISGDVKSLHTGEAGSVLAGQVYRGQVGGSARADIRANPSIAFPDGESLARLFVAGTVETGVTISADNARVDTVVVGLPGVTGATMKGTIFGDVIFDVVVHGRIEHPGAGAAVYSNYGEIRSIVADGIVGDVLVAVEANDGVHSRLGRLICNGDFVGTLRAHKFDALGEACDGIRIEGSLFGLIEDIDKNSEKRGIYEPIYIGAASPAGYIYAQNILGKPPGGPCAPGLNLTFVGGIGGIVVGDRAPSSGSGNPPPGLLGYSLPEVLDLELEYPVTITSIGGSVSVVPPYIDGEAKDLWIGPKVTIESIDGDISEVECGSIFGGAKVLAEDGTIGSFIAWPRSSSRSGGADAVVVRAANIGSMIGGGFEIDCVVGDGVSAGGHIDNLYFRELHGTINVGSFNTLDILGNLAASVRVRAPAAGGLIRIGGSLAVYPELLPPTEAGAISLIGNTSGNSTFVILNAYNNGGAWQARDGMFATVTVETASGPISLAPAPTAQPNQAPYYDRTPAELGGISAGLAPFHLHAAACEPPRNQSTPPVFLNSAFGHVPPAFPGAYAFAEIVMPLYGPIRTASLTAHPVTITRDVPGSPEPPIEGYTVTLKRGDEPGLSRVMTIHGNGSLLLPGTYTIRPKRDTELLEVLRCDGLLTSAIVPVADFEYTFILEGDCNANGVEDIAEIALQPGKDQWPMNGVIDACEDCAADLNCDEALDGFDVEVMDRLVGGDGSDFCGIDPDFNHDFALDGFDVLAVEVAVGGGGCP